MDEITKNSFKNKFNHLDEVARAQYNDIIKSLDFIREQFEKSSQNEHETSEQLITKCEELCTNVKKCNIGIFPALNDLRQCLNNVKTKMKETVKQANANNEKSVSNEATSSNSNPNPNTHPKNNTETVNDHDDHLKEQQSFNTDADEEGENVQFSEKDWKARRRIIKLDKQILFWNRRIHKIENMEHDFNDPDYEEKQEYFYEYESKLKSCIVKGNKRLKELMKKHPNVIDPNSKFQNFNKRINFKHTNYSEINAEIEKNLNKKKSLDIFPAFCDVHSWIQTVNTNANLNLSSDQIQAISLDSFKEIGRLLKLKRYHDDEFIHRTRLEDTRKYEKEQEGKTSDSESVKSEHDPANNDKELAQKLEMNKKQAQEAENKIFEEFVRLQEKNAVEGIIEEDESDDEEEDEDDKEDEVEGEVSLLGSHSSNGSDIENLSESENEDEIDDNEDDMHEEEIEPQLASKSSSSKGFSHSIQVAKVTNSITSTDSSEKNDTLNIAKSENKRPIDLIQDQDMSGKENLGSSSEPCNSKKFKTDQVTSAKRHIKPTQIFEAKVEKSENNSNSGILLKKFPSVKRSKVNESHLNNETSNVKSRHSPAPDDCIILD